MMNDRRLSFSVTPGVFSALSNRDDSRAYYLLDGDLSQMGIMHDRLLARGYPVVKSDVYPGFRREHLDLYVSALRYLYESRVEGWWNQERKLIEHGICTQEEYDRALGRTPRPSAD